jgi:hypothetical protein
VGSRLARAVGWLGLLLTAIAGVTACQPEPREGPPGADEPLASATLPRLGYVRLVPVADLAARPRVDYLLQDVQGRTLLKLPDFPPNQEYAYDETRAAAFADLDGDGRDDLAIIARYMTGIGPSGADPFDVAGFYLRAEEGFTAAPGLGEQINAPDRRERWQSIAELIEVARAAAH